MLPSTYHCVTLWKRHAQIQYKHVCACSLVISLRLGLVNEDTKCDTLYTETYYLPQVNKLMYSRVKTNLVFVLLTWDGTYFCITYMRHNVITVYNKTSKLECLLHLTELLPMLNYFLVVSNSLHKGILF